MKFTMLEIEGGYDEDSGYRQHGFIGEPYH